MAGFEFYSPKRSGETTAERRTRERNEKQKELEDEWLQHQRDFGPVHDGCGRSVSALVLRMRSLCAVRS